MGIKGLLPALSEIQEDTHLAEYRHKRIAVDVSTWLHRFAHSCALDILLGKPAHGCIAGCLKYARLLRSFDIHGVYVFDGADLPAKEGTAKNRRARREAARAEALKLYQQGKLRAATQMAQRAVTISHELAHMLFLKLTAENLQCVIAPYEADAQLGYLSATGYVDAVLSTDSDLLLHGTRTVLYNLESDGRCRRIMLDDLPRAGVLRSQKYSHAAFLMCCIVAGCDYLPSLPGIGIRKAAQIVERAGADPDAICATIKEAVDQNKLKSVAEVPETYCDGLKVAFCAFQYQWVYDLKTQELKQPCPLATLNEKPDISVFEPYIPRTIGIQLDKTILLRIVNGSVNPRTLAVYTLEKRENVITSGHSPLKTSTTVPAFPTGHAQRVASRKQRLPVNRTMKGGNAQKRIPSAANQAPLNVLKTKRLRVAEMATIRDTPSFKEKGQLSVDALSVFHYTSTSALERQVLGTTSSKPEETKSVQSRNLLRHETSDFSSPRPTAASRENTGQVTSQVHSNYKDSERIISFSLSC